MKADLKKRIRTAKREAWKQICDKINEDVWGDGYRLIKKQFSGPALPFALDPDFKRRVLCELFPDREDARLPQEAAEAGRLFTTDELTEAAERLRTGSAPGPDEIPPEVIKRLCAVEAEFVLRMLNRLLGMQTFPPEWKEARVVLLLKSGKPIDSPRAYRPICLLSVLGKLYEQLIKGRLVAEWEEQGDFSPRQFGFRQGLSTIDALSRLVNTIDGIKVKYGMLITLDVRNAFNTACWSKIGSKLRRKNISPYLINLVESYLWGRKVRLGHLTKQLTAGVPQGSVLGPTLWNILYDEVFEIELPADVERFGYADDLAILVYSNKKEVLEANANIAMLRIAALMRENKLELAPEKTEALMIRGPKNVQIDWRLELGSTVIPVQKKIKYLGVIWDWQGLFGEHVAYVTKKAQERISALNRLMPNIGGSIAAKRQVLAAVVHSIVLYAAPIWNRVLRMQKHKNALTAAQRKALLRVISAYRTVSAAAAQVIAGVPPIHLLVEERTALYEARPGYGNGKEARDRTIERWQEEWDAHGSTAQWTKTLIPDIKPWLDCPHRTTDYYFTQALTGHGYFGTFTHRIGKAANEICRYCGERDTPAHAIFQCARELETRRRVEIKIGGVFDPGLVIGSMCRSKLVWDEVFTFVRTTMKNREENERREQAEAAAEA